MTWNQALERRWQELEGEIKARQPMVDEWDRLKKEQELLARIRDLQVGGATVPIHQPRRASKGEWKALCDKHGWHVGGDSAHRVVMRNDPALHASVPHKCDYDQRAYP